MHFAARSPDPSARLAAIERKLDLIMQHLGAAEPEPEVDPLVVEELRAGRGIQAIRMSRALTGAGPREAKDEVDTLERWYGPA